MLSSGGGSTVSSGGHLRVGVLGRGVRLDILDLRLHDPRDADLCPDLDLAGSDLAVVVSLVDLPALLHLTVAACPGRIVAEDLDRLLAGVEASVAGLRLFLLVALADLILEAPAL